MTGFEPQITGIANDCSTNWAHNHCPRIKNVITPIDGSSSMRV